MKNPLFKGFGYIIYISVWFFIALTHTGILHFYYKTNLVISATESLIYNGTFAIVAPTFWYIVRFSGKRSDYLSLIAMHIGTAAISVIIWSGIASIPLKFLFTSNQSYIAFMSGAYIWRIIIGCMYYSIIILIFYLIKFYQDTQTKTKRETELQHLLKDAELRMLKSQINPHFIFNSLNSISALTISKPEQAQDMVIKLSDFLRHSLGKEIHEMNSLREEIANMELYLEIEKIRFGSKLHFINDISEHCLNLQVPNLILQPLCENAIKFGLYESLDTVSVSINCEKSDHFWTITMQNNFDQDAIPPKGAGIGLKNISKRLQLIYGRTDLLQTIKTNSTFTVQIRIPQH